MDTLAACLTEIASEIGMTGPQFDTLVGKVGDITNSQAQSQGSELELIPEGEVSIDQLGDLILENDGVIAQLRNGNSVRVLSASTNDPQLAIFDPVANPPFLTIPREQFAKAWSGVLWIVRWTKQHAHSGEETSNAKELKLRGTLRELLFDRLTLTTLLGATVLVNLLSMTSPFLLMVLLDKVVSHNSWSTLTALGVGAGILVIFEATLEFIRARSQIETSERIQGPMQIGAVARYLDAYTPLTRIQPGQVLHDFRVLDTAKDLVANRAPTFLGDYLFALIFLVVLFWLSVPLAAIVMGVSVIQVAIHLIALPFAKAQQHAANDASRNQDADFAAAVHQAETVTQLGITDRILTNLTATQKNSHVERMSAQRVTTLIRLGVTLLERLGYIILISVGAALVMNSSLSVGALVACAILSRRVMGPLARLPHAYQDYAEGKETLPKLIDTLRYQKERNARKKIQRRQLPTRSPLDIVFSRVYLQLPPPTRFAITLDLHISAGAHVAIVGRAGAGKTTLMHLVSGQLRPQSGHVVLGGTFLSELDISATRARLGIVPQSGMAIRGTIWENLTVGVTPTPTLDEVAEAARAADLHELIQSFPSGYATEIDPNGGPFSYGQRQKLAIARAIIRSPSTFLLDEATESLDPIAERKLIDNLFMKFPSSTFIIATHSQFVAAQCDRVLFVENGRVIGDGPHAQLMATLKSYASYWGRN